MAETTILGAGSWALGLGILLADNGHEVTVWSAVEDEIRILEKDRENPKFLPGIRLPESIKLTLDIAEAARGGRDVIVLAVASKFTRATASRLKGLINPGQVIVTVAKGLEENTLFTLREVILQELPESDVYVLSGPSHAEEVSRRLPTLVTIAGEDEEVAKKLQDIFSSTVFRVYTSTDWLGVEIGGALKNVIALAAGISDGLGYGDNAKAALITRGIREMSRLAEEMGANYETLNGLSGLGDLIVTCSSIHSRNRRAGILLGQGKSTEEAIAEVNMVVEGIVSAKAAMELATRHKVEMPIIEAVNKVLFEGMDPRQAVNDLMTREYISE
ncbi:MAG: NAD(P)H-dependent glycerol-3-phosphate dehydrogenase [Lachnospiraceae bacterium]|jgi:glycerol-3-phosphate dehydrogenase (NAD(P)+)